MELSAVTGSTTKRVTSTTNIKKPDKDRSSSATDKIVAGLNRESTANKGSHSNTNISKGGGVGVTMPSAAAAKKQIKLDPTAAAWKPVVLVPVGTTTTTTTTTSAKTGSAAATATVPAVSAWSNKQSTMDTIKAAASKPVAAAANKPAASQSKVVAAAEGNTTSAIKGHPQHPTQHHHHHHHHRKPQNNNKQDKSKVPSQQQKLTSLSSVKQQAPPIVTASGRNNNWAGAVAAKQHHPQLPQASTPVLETTGGKKHLEQQQQQQKHHAHHNNKPHHHHYTHHNKDHAGKKLDAKDANLLEPYEGVSNQDGVMRFSHATLLQLRILFLNPPEDMAANVSAAQDATVGQSSNTSKENIRPEFLWTSPTRVDDIMLQHANPRITKPYAYGDQHQHPKDHKNIHPSTTLNTSNNEPLGNKGNSGKASSNDDPNIFVNEFGEEIYVKPLVVNEETRWKPKIVKGGDSSAEDKDADAAAIQRALLILNKLTPTNFPKLSEQFSDEVVSSESLLVNGIKLLITKAQQEPHFCPMYAQVCLTLASKLLPFESNNDESSDTKKQKPGKTFKRHLLEECQQEFEISTMREKPDTTTADKNTEELTSEEIEYRTRLAKKKYLGHMTFIGEIYKVGLCNTKVMLMCLPILLDSSSASSEESVDEENIECFVKLMATIGEKLQNDCTTQAQQKGKPESLKQWDMSWERVASMIGSKNDDTKSVSNRIKFMLQDLIELRNNGWVARRKLETAKTLQEIHSEAAKELPRGRISSTSSLRSLAGGQSSSSSNLIRGLSTEDVKNLDTNVTTTDSDGFTTVAKVKRTQSQSSLRRATSGGSLSGGTGITNPSGNVRRSVSDAASSSSIRRKKSQDKGFDNNSSYPELQDSASFASVNETKEAGNAEGFPVTESEEVQSNFASIPELSDEQPPVKSALLLLSPKECGQKVTAVLKDYLVNHDMFDAYVSYEELVQPSQPHSLERGAKCVEASLQFMMEQSKARLETFLHLWKILVLGNAEADKEKKRAIFNRPMIIEGLRYPLDALADIMIDAPLANVILLKIVASTMLWGALAADVSFLMEMAPDSSFQAEGYAAFAVNLLRAFSQLTSNNPAVLLDKNVDLIGKLMTPDEKEEWKSVGDFIKCVTERSLAI